MPASRFLTEDLKRTLEEYDTNFEATVETTVAFPHPITGRPVFLVPDFPHNIKKFVNGLENNKRVITRTVKTLAGEEHEEPLSLKMMKDAWKWSNADTRAAPAGSVALSADSFTDQHFIKTP